MVVFRLSLNAWGKHGLFQDLAPLVEMGSRNWDHTSSSLGPAQGSSRFTRRFGQGIAACGNPSALCWSPVREGAYWSTLDWLTWPRIPASMLTLQYRHEATPRHGAMCPRPLIYLSCRRVLSPPSLCQYIPRLISPTNVSVCFHCAPKH